MREQFELHLNSSLFIINLHNIIVAIDSHLDPQGTFSLSLLPNLNFTQSPHIHPKIRKPKLLFLDADFFSHPLLPQEDGDLGNEGHGRCGVLD